MLFDERNSPPGSSEKAGTPIASHSEAGTKVSCVHCGLPVPPGLVEPETTEQFCCQGCRMAYAIIREHDLADYYSLRDRIGSDPQSSAGRGNQYEEMDDATFHELYVSAGNGRTARTEFYLEGVHCAACVWLIERLPQVLPGVVEARVHLTNATVILTWQPDVIPLSRVAQTLDRLGYPPHPRTDDSRQQARQRENRRQLGRIAVAAACAGNTMLIAVALYAGMFSGMQDEYRNLFRWFSAALGGLAVVWPGYVFFRGAWSAIRTRTPHMDLPVALGLGVGLIAGLYNTIIGTGEVYFDSLSVLVFLLLVGRWIQFQQQQRAADSVAIMHAVTPRNAHRVQQGNTRDVPVEALRCGDVVVIRPGETIPADGTILQGSSTVDQALLTGESTPIRATPGDGLTAGAVNLSSTLRMQVTATGYDSRIGKLARMVEEAALTKAPIVQIANRVGGYFVIVVMLLALGTTVYWARAGLDVSLERAVALLIVACPCALALATPLALAVAQGRAARRSIVIKGGEALERLSKPGRIWLDKTGTLTEGRMIVRLWHGPAEIRPLLAALESRASHPIATAIVAAAQAGSASSELDEPEVEAFEQVQGAGIQGRVGVHDLLAGSQSLLQSHGIELTLEEQRQLDEVVAGGLTPVIVAVDGRYSTLLGVGDQVRADAEPAVRHLLSRGWQLGILSGDHPEIVQQISAQVGLGDAEVFGGVTPEEKLAIVKDSLQDGTVVMVGDGVNDTAALAAATVGVAVHGGAEVSLDAATVYLGREGLTPLVELVDGAQATVRVIYRNFAASLSYNVVAVGLAATGWINPLTAAVLMPLSSLTVVGLSLGSRVFGGPR